MSISPARRSLEQRARLVFVEKELEPREVPLERGRDPWEQVGSDRRDQRQPHLPGERITLGPRDLDDGIRLLQHASRTLDHFRAGRRQRHALGLPLDECHAQVTLELADLGGERRLADGAALGRPAEMPLVGQRHEVAEVAEIHVSMLPSTIDNVYRTIKTIHWMYRRLTPRILPIESLDQEISMLGIGQKFPAYTLTGVVSNDLDKGFKPFTQDSDVGKWKVFFFWPKDFTFVCPTEIAAFGRIRSSSATGTRSSTASVSTPSSCTSPGARATKI